MNSISISSPKEEKRSLGGRQDFASDPLPVNEFGRCDPSQVMVRNP
jgi:hypothetical protein